MTLLIRPCIPEDGEYILSLVPRFSGFDLPTWRQASEIDVANRAHLEAALRQPGPDHTIYVTVDESDRLVGFIHLQTRRDYFSGEEHGYIADVAVDPSFEGQGIGRLLLETAESWAREHGYALLALEVFAGNERARRIYEKLGYQEEIVKYVKLIGP